MATVELTSSNFEQTLQDNDIVILDFWASWCGPCVRFAPTFEKVSEEHGDIVFGKVNTEEQQELAAAFGIRSIPTVAIFRERVPVFREAGMLPEAALQDLIKQVRALDMAEVHADYEKQLAEA